MKKTGAVLVAAGMSSRMGDFKPALAFGDSTVARTTISKIKKLGIEPITVVTGHREDDLKKAIDLDGIRYVKNENYETTHMFDSIVIGVSDIIDKCDRIMMMPIDLPGIPEEIIEEVLETEGELIRTMCHGRPGHPIIMGKDFAKSLKDYSGEGGLKGAMESYGVPIIDIEVDDVTVYFDMDTPEEYRKLIEIVNKRDGQKVNFK